MKRTMRAKGLATSLVAGVALAALAACASGGSGFGQAGCRTVYVFQPGPGGIGVVQPRSSCAEVPRDHLEAQTQFASRLTLPELLTSEQAPSEPSSGEQAAPDSAPIDGESTEADRAPRAVHAVSPAALATRPAYPPADPYDGPNEMLENADMAAFMARVHQDYAARRNQGAWVYAIIDALAAGDPAYADAVMRATSSRQAAPDALTAAHLRPWVTAFLGNAEQAKTEMAQLRRLLPGATLLGHRALLVEGLGDAEGALAVYNEAPQPFAPPKIEDAGTPAYLVQAVAFNGQRLLALRQAELLRAMKRDAEALALLQRLKEAVPDDLYVASRIEKTRKGEDRPALRTLPQAMSLALSDQADLVEERQAIMSMMVARGQKIPFNHLIASLRQSALLLDPGNGEARLQEVTDLYTQGFFEAALRLAQVAEPRSKAIGANLQSTAGLAALHLGSPETMLAMTENSLRVDSSPESKLSAAGALIGAGYPDRAMRLIEQAMRSGLDERRQVAAVMTRAQAKQQSGDLAGAVADAREARRLDDDNDTKQFLASMLVQTPERAEGLAIMREMLVESPGNPGQMNNLGYALVNGYANRDELDEGFRMLREAIRVAPDEPNLLDSVGWAFYQYGDYREARRYIEMAVQAFAPFDHWEILDHLGDIKWRMDEKEAAQVDWREALDARPPVHDRARIEAKLRDGLTDPAPEAAEPPDVPRVRPRGGVSDI